MGHSPLASEALSLTSTSFSPGFLLPLGFPSLHQILNCHPRVIMSHNFPLSVHSGFSPGDLIPLMALAVLSRAPRMLWLQPLITLPRALCVHCFTYGCLRHLKLKSQTDLIIFPPKLAPSPVWHHFPPSPGSQTSSDSFLHIH